MLAARKDRPVAIALPKVAGADDLAAAASAIVEAMGEGVLTPLEAGAAMSVLQGAAGVFSTADLAERIALLEAAAPLFDEDDKGTVQRLGGMRTQTI